MKDKLIIASSIGLGLLTSPFSVLAGPRDIGNLQFTNQGVPVGTNLGTVIVNALKIIYIIAAIAVLFMLVIGAFQWITSGGDKEAVQKARSRITNALIGLAILAFALFITVLVGEILNINILNQPNIPTIIGNT